VRARRSRGTCGLGAVFVPTLALLLVAACGGDEPRAPRQRSGDLPTVDVAPPPDARVDVDRDAKERRRNESFAGVLPARFPRSLPLPPQASLVDQGPGWVELLVPRRPPAVRTPYVEQLRAAGWEVSSTGTDRWHCRRGDEAVELSLSAQGPSTRLRLGY
jgi:hypothetical protein